MNLPSLTVATFWLCLITLVALVLPSLHPLSIHKDTVVSSIIFKVRRALETALGASDNSGWVCVP